MSYSRKMVYHRYMPERSWEIIRAAVTTAIQRAGGTRKFCEAVGVGPSQVSRWRSGERLPTIEQAMRTEKATGVSRKSILPIYDWSHFDEGLYTDDKV